MPTYIKKQDKVKTVEDKKEPSALANKKNDGIAL